jgi:hypothetical protein
MAGEKIKKAAKEAFKEMTDRGKKAITREKNVIRKAVEGVPVTQSPMEYYTRKAIRKVTRKKTRGGGR